MSLDTESLLLQQQGVPVRVAMPGHSQISMTMHDTHVVDELAHAAALSTTKALWDCDDRAVHPAWTRRWHRSGTQPVDSADAPDVSVQVTRGAASENRTPDNLITRSPG